MFPFNIPYVIDAENNMQMNIKIMIILSVIFSPLNVIGFLEKELPSNLDQFSIYF